MYVAVKGGERAIANAHALLAKEGRGDTGSPVVTATQIAGQLGVLVARVMSEGSLYDPELAGRAIAQAQGDVLEAITLVRSYRTTLPRFGYSEPVDTGALPPQRRVSATYKDLPGGQQLGATFDYTHRLFTERDTDGPEPADLAGDVHMPRVTDLLAGGDLIEPAEPNPADPEPTDITRDPTTFPMSRAGRLQALARGDEGFLLSLGYSTQRGYGRTHPFAGEIRVGEVEVEYVAPELGFAIPMGRIEVTECQMINQFTGNSDTPAQFTRGYGLTFGRGERKAMSMSLVDRALRTDEFAERVVAPAQDEEFVISHADNVAATGFVEHLKLPHYVDFQAELVLVRQLHADFRRRAAGVADDPTSTPSSAPTTGFGTAEPDTEAS
ncbi:MULTISPECIES: carbon-phosphorus lyase complex subunit PhnI [Gordonia]|uniref:carbon-phosphorus lyase complex subunit PhnI n=1 Tax=Gordonia TaxID=2053 RepID=UPI0004B88224|nr:MULTISPECIES: carbon-phosphorus lyase complex subunit PhnI [Gordonia]MDH3008065.1 carbon-phosphorus lyase complex subunit PhnI [Gordonia alkanivorans]MDH3011714.1 carbon-phosphorus lyase complex subunit PhnI [Gordonia alkanivorans]MDH3016876.1 carbon-phosphorus lyase complex subunit PhnI [Gordonia alkanivorans]MDH3020930.1 carbon-phosphorus lyase complex subunit PhnI [Gordonia alkanivorans]MDH3042121.1 carbon-phosphorus lyase complex subunit PhnI [Gordonia alkanivorans]